MRSAGAWSTVRPCVPPVRETGIAGDESRARFVIDGTNVLLVHGRKNPELRYVLALCDHLFALGEGFVCVFDANTSYLLEQHSAEQAGIFPRIIREMPWSRSIHIVPGGTQADEWILKRAKADGADVISNDKYRDRARAHRWIWKRRHPLQGIRDAIILASLEWEVPVLPAAADYF